jgi:hypothetical protein
MMQRAMKAGLDFIAIEPSQVRLSFDYLSRRQGARNAAAFANNLNLGGVVEIIEPQIGFPVHWRFPSFGDQ